MKKTLLFVFVLFCVFTYSQNSICGAKPDKNEIFNTEKKNKESVLLFGEKTSTASVLYIPTVVHVIYHHPYDNLSDAQVISQINHLNIDLRLMNADTLNIPTVFRPFAADTKIQLCLAQQTPDGLPTNGIVHKYSNDTVFGSAREKYNKHGGDDAWDIDRYFNIWVAPNLGAYAGYAVFPTINNQFNDYGISLQTSRFNASDRLINHEVGHAFNLYHIWGNYWCEEDSVSDTPFQGYENIGCPTFPNSSLLNNGSCGTMNASNLPNGDMFMNYMDYTNSSCQNMFTIGQSQRMRASISELTPNLITSNGCQPLSPLTLDMSLDKVIGIAQRSCQVSYSPKVRLRNMGSTNLNYSEVVLSIDNNVVSVYAWNGNQGYLDTTVVSLQPFSVTSGKHILKVFCRNPNMTSDMNCFNDTITKVFFSYLIGENLPYQEGFENSVFPSENCTIYNEDLGFSFQQESSLIAKGCQGNYCLRLDNSTCKNHYPSSEIYCWKPLDEFSLPNLNLSSLLIPKLSFRYAYSNLNFITGSLHFTDTLEVLISTDCGYSFQSIYMKSDSALCTCYPLSIDSSVFYPANENQWRQEVIDLSSYQNNNNVLVKFRVYGFSLGYGNNIYLDDINITNSVGIKETDFLNSISVYPNPSNNFVKINSSIKDLKIEVFDIIGKFVIVNLNKLEHDQWQLNFENIDTGVYFVKLSSNGKSISRKLIVIK
jgi:hypothetical protein